MVVAVQAPPITTAIVPVRPSSSASRTGGGGGSSRLGDEPVLEIKQKTASRHEKRTKRNYYRHSGDDKQPPIEYVYTYSEETPRPATDPNTNNKTWTDLVPVNGNGATGKIECTVGEDGNLVVKIRGKPDSVPLDPDNLPIKLPDGWQLKEIQTNQRSRKTERSRKTRIKDEVLLDDEENEKAMVVYQDHTVAVIGSIAHLAENGESGEQSQFGNADEEEYIQDERDGMTYVQKKSRKYEQGPAGLTSKIEESRSEQGVDFDHPNNKQRSSRNLHSLMERSESSRRKFSKQSVTDEKVTEKHTSNVMYFDSDSSQIASGPARQQNLHHDERTSTSRGRRDYQQDHDVIVESPDDTPYNSLDRRHQRRRQEDVETIHTDDRYHFQSPTDERDRIGDANYDSSNYSTVNRTEKDVTHTEKDLYREDIYRPDSRASGGPRTEKDVTQTERELYREDFYGPDGRARQPGGKHLDERIDRTNISDRFEFGPGGERVEKDVVQTDRELFREDIYGPDGRPVRKGQTGSHFDERTERTNVTENYRYGPGSKVQPSGQTTQQIDRREQSLYDRSDTRNTNLSDRADYRADSRQGPVNTSSNFAETSQKTNITENYRQTGQPSQPRPQSTSQIQPSSQKTVSDDYTKTSVSERHVVHPSGVQPIQPAPTGRRSDSQQTSENRVETHSEYRSTVAGRDGRPIDRDIELRSDRGGGDNTVKEHRERTDVREIYLSGRPVVSGPDSRETRTETKSESKSEYRASSDQLNSQGTVGPTDRGGDTRRTETVTTVRDSVTDRENRIEGPGKKFQPRQANEKTSSYTELRRVDGSDDLRGTLEKRTDHTEKTSTSTTDMVGIHVNGGTQSPGPQERRGVTIDDRYRVIGRSDEQQPRPTPGVRYSKADEVRQQQTDSTYSQQVTEKDKYRSHSRLTEASSTGERIVPIGVSGGPDRDASRVSSRLSSVDLSEIKVNDHLDNQILKDRGNLAQNGSMGQRRPPTRNPVKYHFGDENGPDDVLSTSDTTLPTHFGGAPFQATSVPRGPSVASSDLYIDRHGFDKTQTYSATKQQSTTRDERVLINYTDTSSKPDWVQNIDQHFSGQSGVQQHNIHYSREKITSPTPRIEEIVTIPGSTVITVNGEDKPIHGIVTEPGDRPLLPSTIPIERDVVHQSEKGSKYGFTRVTESKGYKQSAKENVQYQERRENTRQIAVSYSIPGKGKETREYTWDGVHDQPQEKITFQEDRRHQKEVSFTLGLDSQSPVPPPQRTTTERTETKDLKERIVFAETRSPPPREVAVNLSLQTDRQKQEITQRHPIETNTIHFEEEIKRERAVNFVLGLEAQQQRPESVHEHHETHRSAHHERKELYDVRADETRRIDYHEPSPPRVTFREDREVKKDVSFTLGLENYDTAPQFEPLPVEKITFEETREIRADHDVAVVFGLDEPIRRPPSAVSRSTVFTPDIVPQYTTNVKEQIKTVEVFERIVEEARVESPKPPPSPPSAVMIAATEIIPPLPRKVSLAAAIESAAVVHSEVEIDRLSDRGRIYETSIEKAAREKRERAEKHIEVQAPPPPALPPTSGRVEKHVHLETIIPEPTGEHLPDALGTYGFVYTATLEPKKPDHDQTIDFQVMETTPVPPAVSEEVTETHLQWYVKEGKVPSEVDLESVTTIGELRVATPPRHDSLTGIEEIVPPSRVTEVVKERPKTTKVEKTRVTGEIAPPIKEFYFGEDEEDRLSVHSGQSWEETKKPPPVKETAVSELIRKPTRPGVQAESTHHTEVSFATPEEEELWKTSLERYALPSRKRTEQTLQLERTEEITHPLPRPSGRIPKKTQTEKMAPEPTGIHGRKVLGTYGFIYTATLNPQTVIRERPIEVEEWQLSSVSSSIDLDVQQVLLSAFTEIEPILTEKQQEQLLISSLEIFPPLSEEQQKRLINAIVTIHPKLTIDQQRQLLTGEEIVPPLTDRQQQQLVTASAEVIPGLTYRQEKQLFYASMQVNPPLTASQQQQLLFAVSEIFPPASGHRRPHMRSIAELEVMVREIEEEFDEEERLYKFERERKEQARFEREEKIRQITYAESTHHSEVEFETPEEEERWKATLNRYPGPRRERTEGKIELEQPDKTIRPLPQPSGRIPKKTWSEKVDTETTSVHGKKALGSYGFLYTATIKPEPSKPGKRLETVSSEWHISSVTHTIDFDVQQLLLSSFLEIQPPLAPQQQHQLLISSLEIFPPLTSHQQERLVNAILTIHPRLTIDQQRQLFMGIEISPMLTVSQQQQLITASTDIISTFTYKQEKRLFYASLQVNPPLTTDQQRQLLFAVAQNFPPVKGQRRPKMRTIRELEEMLKEIEEEIEEEERVYTFERKETIGRINRRGEWEKLEKTTTETENKESMSTDIRNRRKPYETTPYSTKDETWTDDTYERRTLTEEQRRNERHIGHRDYRRDKEVPLPSRWQSEQTTYLEDQDLEVSAISMNVRPRVKSEILMAPSPPARSLSPHVGSGFRYSASPQRGTPPMHESAGFIYEAAVDGRGSPMSVELGTYGFTYQATLDGSEPYRKLSETTQRELAIRTESHMTPRPMSATPPRRSPWSTPPVTPTPVLGTATPGGVTPLPSGHELPEPSRNSPWKKSPSPPHGESSFGRTTYEKEITSKKDFSAVEMKFPTGTSHRQELYGRLGSPEEEIHERITEKVIRRRHDELSREEEELNKIASDAAKWIKPTPPSGERFETESTFSQTTTSRQERVEREHRQGLGDRGPPKTPFKCDYPPMEPADVHPPTKPFKCDYPPMEPTPPPRSSSAERTSSRSSSHEEVARKAAEVIRQAEEMESLYDESRRRDRSTSSDRRTTSTTNRVQEMAVRYDSHQQEETSHHGHQWPGPSSSAVDRELEVTAKRVREVEVEQQTLAAAAKRKKDLAEEERARRERAEKERETAAVVRRVKEMEDEQRRIREAHEREMRSRKVVEPVQPFLGQPPDRIVEQKLIRSQHREVHFEDETTTSVDPQENQPDWVWLVEDRKRRQEPQKQHFRPDKYSRKDTVSRQLEAFPEEDPTEAALERASERKKQSIKGSPDGSPSSLRKWSASGALSASTSKLPTVTKDDINFNKGFTRRTVETKEVIEESRFHSEEAMLEALEAGNSNLISTMSQSLPSLSHLKNMEEEAFSAGLRPDIEGVVSMEELRKTSTKVLRTDGAEEETRDESFERRGDTVSPETKRTKRTVVRKLINGEWKEVAVREEDVPVDVDALATRSQPVENILAGLRKSPDDDEWSLSDAVIEETTTTRTIRRVEEEEEDIVSLAGTDT